MAEVRFPNCHECGLGNLTRGLWRSSRKVRWRWRGGKVRKWEASVQLIRLSPLFCLTESRKQSAAYSSQYSPHSNSNNASQTFLRCNATITNFSTFTAVGALFTAMFTAVGAPPSFVSPVTCPPCWATNTRVSLVFS